ncbi:MAG: hypothetical protein AB8G15_16665 [Saprospiraceae bacterium]
MKKFSRLLPLSAFLLMLLSVAIFSCQKTDIAPVNEKDLAQQNPEFQLDAEPIDEDCAGYNFIPLTEDEFAMLEEMGIDAFWEEMGFDECKDYETTSGDAQRYCNYKVTRVIRRPNAGPPVGHKFCVVCPPKCAKGGILWNFNGYRAKAVLNQGGRNCASCFGGPVYPRRRR